MIKIEFENTLKRALSEGLNLFLGAGFSILSEDRAGRRLPLGSELATELIETFKEPQLADLPLSKICTILESSRKNELRDYLLNRFIIKTVPQEYNSLLTVAVNSIFTTNIDDLIYQLYGTSDNSYINDVTVRGPAYGDKIAIDYVPLNGSVFHRTGDLTFSTLDLATAFASDRDKWHFITEGIQKKPTIFWGHGVEDAAVLESISPRTIKGREHQTKWIVLTKEDPATIAYYRALEFSIIISDTKSLLEYISSLNLRSDRVSNVKLPTEELFPQESIPSVDKAPVVRPLIDFYAGAPPLWSDIYSGRLHKTEYFSEIIDSINSGKNTLVIGLPGTGKTTLMMQISSEAKVKGHKLAIESLSPEKAELILKRLNKEKAVIFIDNFTDSMDSFEMMCQNANVQLIGFDRDYNYEIISHRIDQDSFNIIDVTSLYDKDVQAIFSNIPREIRHSSFVQPVIEEGSDASLFEIIEANLITPTLRSRFNSVLQQLTTESVDLHDLLVMCCYVHSCRTPVSFDMVYSFLRGKISDYKDVYVMVDRLASLISEYSGHLIIDTIQDYFVPRSIYVSEAVIRQVSPSALKRVILCFHEEVSPFRIARFDVFRRKAFDANTMKRAFNDWNEGKKFYELAFERDESPYVLQQGALFLAHKRRYSDAFSWIDQARLMSADRIFSIRNSYAIILFGANIDAPENDPTVRKTLDESMKIIEQCYSDDKRKRYHALTFANQALKYSEKYGDPVSIEYLQKAHKWLVEERNESPWHRGVRHLLTRTQSELKKYT